jgi:hypothetical protein
VVKNPIAIFRHPDRSTVKAEVDFCLDGIRRGDSYLTARYASEPLAEQVSHYLNEPAFDDSSLFAAGAFCYRPTTAVKSMLKDWYLESYRWSCQDQLSLPVVMQRHGITPSLFDADQLSNPYLTYLGHVLR